MSESILGVVRKVARRETEKILTTELGVVTAIFPHAAESDQDNYQVSVRLKNRKQPDGSDFELRKVPVATPHVGLVNVPNVGDLVLVTFLGGELNAPVVTGRLYNDEDRPPVNREKELLLQHDLEGGGTLKIDQKGVITLTSKNDQCMITVEDGGITLDAGSADVTVKSTGTVRVGDGSTTAVELGGRAAAKAVGDGDNILLSTHTHVGNMGAPCPVLVPMEKIDSIQAKTRNTTVG